MRAGARHDDRVHLGPGTSIDAGGMSLHMALELEEVGVPAMPGATANTLLCSMAARMPVGSHHQPGTIPLTT